MAEDQPIVPIEQTLYGFGDIRDLISFRIHRLAIANDRHGQRLLSTRFGLSLPQWRVIGVVWALGPNAPISRILDDLSMNKSQLSRELKALIEMGLVATTEDAADRRRIRASLTEKGVGLHDEVMEYLREHNRLMLSILGSDLADRFVEGLDSLTRWTEDEVARLQKS